MRQAGERNLADDRAHQVRAERDLDRLPPVTALRARPPRARPPLCPAARRRRRERYHEPLAAVRPGRCLGAGRRAPPPRAHPSAVGKASSVGRTTCTAEFAAAAGRVALAGRRQQLPARTAVVIALAARSPGGSVTPA